MSASLFPRPPGVRPPLQSQAGGRFLREVHSEAGLIEAIRAVADQWDATVFSSVGSAICIASPLTITEPVTIPYKCPGLMIFSNARVPIVTTEAPLSALFVIQAAMVTIRGLFAYGTSSGYFTAFAKLSDPGVAGYDCSQAHVIDNVCWTDRIFWDDTDGGGDDALVADNWQNKATNSATSTILFDSERCTARSNRIEDSTTNAIEVAANGGYCSLVGNFCNGADIVTSASQGYNVIGGNISVGTITDHTTDANYGNTL